MKLFWRRQKLVGFIPNNTYPAEFIYQNLQIQNNVIHLAHIFDVQKLLFWARHVFIKVSRASDGRKLSFKW